MCSGICIFEYFLNPMSKSALGMLISLDTDVS